MIDKKPASEYMEEVRKAIGKLDEFNEKNHISGKAFSSMIIIFLIIILCFVYLWQLKHPKAETPEPTVIEQTQEAAPAEETAPAEEAPAEAPEEPAPAPVDEDDDDGFGDIDKYLAGNGYEDLNEGNKYFK